MQMLSDVTVLELGRRVSTGYCGKLLADAGAEVVRLEPHLGDPLRTSEPGYAAFLHAGKRSVTAGPGQRPAALLPRLVADADAVICDDDEPGILEQVASLRARNSRLIVVVVSDYGTGGPYAGTPATEFTLQSEAGLALLHPTGDRPPVAAGAELGELTGAASAAIGVVTALLSVEADSGQGGIDVDVSRYESLLSTLQYPWLNKQIPDHDPYVLPQSAVPGLEQASDGWVCVVSVTGPQWTDFKKMAGVPELDVPRYETFRQRVVLRDEVTPLIRSFTGRHTVEELVELGARHRVPIVPVGTPRNITSITPYATRGTFVTNAGGGFIQPASPFRDGGEQPWAPAPLAAAGADNGRSIGASRRGHTPSGSAGDARLPLRGLRVLELGTFQAGPLVTRNLAALGADVVKVEAVARPDLIRFIGVPATFNRYWDRGAPFIGTNLGKRSITADLTQSEGLAIVRKLMTRSQLVLDNFLPRVLDERGLGYAGVRALNPDAIMLRLPAWGLSGPWRDRPGFTYSVDATSGLSELTGYPDGEPMMTGTIVDPIASLLSTFIALAAIRHQLRTGWGGLLEVALCDVAAQLTARAVIAASSGGPVPTRAANHDPRIAPQGIYRGADGQWLAVSVATQEQWNAFAGLAGNESWAQDERFATAPERVAHAAELDERLAAFCATVPAGELIARLRAHGIAAAPLNTGEEAHTDPQLLFRGRVFEADHPAAGKVRYLGLPARYSHDPVAGWPSASPVFGQHNNEILAELGYSPSQIQALLDAKAIGDSPFGLPFQR
jgi:crotonobetainyl-CoA:carnitine CoA-transferase CaiB-like acyl-CoA transferase